MSIKKLFAVSAIGVAMGILSASAIAEGDPDKTALANAGAIVLQLPM